MADRATSAADEQTIAACRERGETGLTARMLERWRQTGCLPTRERIHVAGIRGSRSANPDGYVDQVMAMAALMRSRVKLHEAPIALFADGYPVDFEMLKASYSRHLAWFKEYFVKMAMKQAPDAQDSLDIADAAARVTAKHVTRTVLAPWQQRARDLAKQSPAAEKTSPQHLLEGALSTLMTAVFAGEAPSSAGVEEALNVAGFNDGQDPDLSGQKMAAGNVDLMIETVRSASVGDFIVARQLLDGAYRYAAARTRVEQELYLDRISLPGLREMTPSNPLARGLLIPYFLTFQAADRKVARATIRRYEAADRLLTHLPPHLVRFMLPSAEVDLATESQEVRDEVQSYGESFNVLYPEDAEVLRKWPEDL